MAPMSVIPALLIALWFNGVTEGTTGIVDSTIIENEQLQSSTNDLPSSSIMDRNHSDHSSTPRNPLLADPWTVSLREIASHSTHYGGAVLIRVDEKAEKTDMALTSALNCHFFAPGHVAYIGAIHSRLVEPNHVSIVNCYPYGGVKRLGGIDIGIVQFAEAIPFGHSLAQPACLPDDHHPRDIDVDDEGIVLGFGTENEHVGNLVPDKVRVRVVGEKECVGLHKYISKEYTVCVKNVDADQHEEKGGGKIRKIRRGDSGAPFVMISSDDDKTTRAPACPTVFGIVSTDQDRTSDPAVITRVAPFVKNGWIRDMINQHSRIVINQGD